MHKMEFLEQNHSFKVWQSLPWLRHGTRSHLWPRLQITKALQSAAPVWECWVNATDSTPTSTTTSWRRETTRW